MPGTQWPGQLGNFAVAGHRVTAGNPFWSLPSLKDGDLVYIQTRLNNFTYRVTGRQMVTPADTAVLDPVPGHPRQRPVGLTACGPHDLRPHGLTAWGRSEPQAAAVVVAATLAVVPAAGVVRGRTPGGGRAAGGRG